MPINVCDVMKDYIRILHTPNWHYSHFWLAEQPEDAVCVGPSIYASWQLS
jgi:hypothetical protein